jgi:amino acid adenylation domain-containing protein
MRNTQQTHPLEIKHPLTEEEQHQLLIKWNATTADYPKEQCIHYLFEQQVERAPDAPALVFEEQQLTYRELNRKANHLAHYLQMLGVGPEVLVGLCVERSVEMVVGLLAVLKAGGAYVPLDATYPTERLMFLLQDSQVVVLLTQERLCLQLSEYQGKILCLDTDWQLIAQQSEANLRPGVNEKNLAYVIYTSGSTGSPKGCMITHGNLLNIYYAWAEIYGLLIAPTCHLQMASFSFDVFSGDVVRALCSGGKLVIAPRELLLESEQLYQLMCKEGVTHAEFVPAVLRRLLQYLEGQQCVCDFMQVLVVGSDSWYDKDYERLRCCFSADTRLVNTYGVTEATIDSTYYDGSLEDWQGDRQVPIGRGFANTRLYVLDQHLQPASPGVQGELYIGGAGVARGYLHRPELTDERFLPDPFNDEPNARLYKTGDLVRYLPDGNLEFLGRLDHQVKIRGFRIELGEIEAMLTQHPAVREAVVVARENIAGDKRLVAYLVATQSPAPLPGELRSYLQERLPYYMLPAAFVSLDAFPLTPNGKIDRNALVVLDEGTHEIDAGYVAPRTSIEELVVAIWIEVLGKKHIGIYDTFWELGGDSLLATLIASRIREIFHIELPLRLLFNTATVAGLAEHIETCIQIASGSPTSTILPLPRERSLSLSVAQQRLWFLEQLVPGTTIYTIPLAFQLKGMLNTTILEQSLNEIVRRHEALRTSFTIVDGHPVQVIASTLQLKLAQIDLRGSFAEEQGAEVSGLIAREIAVPFDLRRGPLLRASLFQLEKQEHVLLLSMHHLISDGWSVGVFLYELAVLYQAYVQGKPSPLPDLSLQYADFAIWQRQRLETGMLDSQLVYWKKQLEGIPALLQLPTDHPRPTLQTFRGAAVSIHLPYLVTATLKTLAQQQEVTLFMTLLAAFQVLLFRYTGQEDIVVGTPIAGRTHRQTEELIGFFVNTLVLRTNLSGNPSFRDLLKRIREVALDAYAHQDVPFERLVEELQPKRDLSHNPLFQVLFVLQDASAEILDISELYVRSFPVEKATVQFDLTLELMETSEGVRGWLEYNTDLFEAATITRMADHLQTLLENIGQTPDLPIGELPLLTESKRRQLLIEWNATETDYPEGQCIHHLFEAQVEHTPGALALIFEEQQLTYHELNTRANQLAHYLQTLGVGPEVPVGLCMERSVEMVVGLLAVLKAGGAYVPLDPAYPSKRLAFLLQDSQMSVLLTQEQLRTRLPEHRAREICLDTDWERIAKQSQTNAKSKVKAENLAYVIYTSGSTGQPKGVQVNHGNLLNLIYWHRRAYRITAHDRATQVTSPAFDATGWEIWPYLAAGASVYFPPEEVRVSPLMLRDWLLEHSITMTFLPTPLAENMLSLDWPTTAPLRYLLTGADTLRKYPPAGLPFTLVNNYGPTETTVVATYGVVLPEEHPTRFPSVGRPIDNTQLYVLDQHLQPVPLGVQGELYIGGAGVARGYLHRPELTSERFLPNPFSHDPNARLYKTSDLVRYLPDGNLEFLGRLDHQVKIRGFRIELGEIETVLVQHPEVREAVVVAQENTAGYKRLVAYLVEVPSSVLHSQELRNYLQKRLPDYMIPAAFVSLDSLPLTPSGKVDYRLLPEPPQERSQLEQAFVAPHDPIEQAIEKIWAQVLGVEQISIHDNFFELGGHSLLATQVISRMCATFQVEMSLRELFEAPTIASLALIVLQKQALDNEKLAQVLAEVEQLSDDEVKTILADSTRAAKEEVSHE